MTDKKPAGEGHRGGKSRKESESDQVKARRQDALKLEKQLQKKKYSRPVDAQSLDAISELMLNMGVKERWKPVGTRSVKFSPLFGTDKQNEGDMATVMATQLQCITAMKNYETRSLEELHLEDHLSDYRYRGEPSGKLLFKKAKKSDADLNYQWDQTGTLEIEFEAVEDTDVDQEGEMAAVHTTLHQCISAMCEYENKSLEELRFEDYLTGLFAIKKYRFNAQPSKNWHEDLKYFSARKNGTAKYEFKPYQDWESMNERGFFSVVRMLNHKCITMMSEYSDQSFEELRLADYFDGRRGPKGPMYKASEEERARLNVHYGMEVYIFIKVGVGLTEIKKKGTIEYIGRRPDKAFGKFYVGINLDEPFGDSNGRYNDIRLFQTEGGHAKLVPLASVYPVALFEDFHSDGSDIEAEVTEPGTAQNLTGMFGSSSKCVVCYSNPVEIFLSPCGHACCCEQCSPRLSDCPLCRKIISEKRKVYLP